MQLTQQQQAIAAAVQVASFMAQLKALYAGITAFLVTNTDQAYAGILAALPTYIFTSQGAQGLYDTTAGAGTVSVTAGSNAITFSQSQSGLSGTYLVVVGDTANGLYLIGSGTGAAWTLASPYGGATNATAAWGTATPNNAHPIALPMGGPLNMAENNILTAVGSLANFATYWTGQAVAVQANTPQKFADLLNS
jgi:hypothetical protein